ncbi:Putative DNA-directed RNA polymerase [Lichtheimia ramosa]|uniref:DNA-directed RNA polymerase subunit n=1 Tax=Lichtheimia ramosa TaxID=688394 RepID=A0A077X3Q4_9FUNG|nr:Putative DNA-directed RNA polymerase [Lichtheimia ramosa]
MSPQNMVKIGELEVTQRDLYQPESRTPVKGGVLDLRMGTSNKQSTCETCGKGMQDCAGHWGYMKLVLPIFHIGYFRATINILQDICKTCSRVMLEEPERRMYLKRLRAPGLDNMQRMKIVKAINEKCKKVTYCPHCKEVNGVVKKIGPMKITHDKYRLKRVATEAEEFRKTFNTAAATMPELKPHISKAQDDLNPLRVLRLFQKVTPEDCELLGLSEEHGRPEWYIWQYLPVPPACIRPSVMQDDNTSNEDDLTAKLTEIVFTNAIIRAGLEKGITVMNLMEQWEFLQLAAAMYINSELPGVPNANQGKPSRGLSQRLKGKQGRFRGNLSGKRVDFSGRTVISPDPNMRIDQVAVPERVAKILTFPERVNKHNIHKLRQNIINGPDVHPGANYVQSQHGGFKKYLRFGNRERIASDLKIGDIVERHLSDNDVVLFNRQPSLHRLSIMAHFAKVMPWRTFRFNECVCSPYNADFDGDEMNMHLPQTQEAKAEAIELMGVKNNLVTPRNGEPLIAATQDFITASYLLSHKDTFYTRAMFCQIASYMFDAEMHIELPPPVVWKPQRLWTGKQIFNLLFKPNKDSKVLLNVEAKSKSFVKEEGRVPDLCPNDGWLVVQNSEIMCGLVDKAIVGDGNKNSVFYVILRDYGAVEAAKCMNRLAKLCARWLGMCGIHEKKFEVLLTITTANQGFSIGISDVTPGKRLREIKDEEVTEAYKKCDEVIAKFKAGQLETMPGCNEEQTMESIVSGILSGVRGDLGKVCMKELNMYNSPSIMARCGSKGSQINVSQMVACVGQQIISGSRVANGFQDRSLPHFLKHSRSPPAKGFVRNSFYSGLTPTEFIFHAMSGREGLVDTAVKTAETGYMQRRLMKAFEDLTTHYDLSVRNSEGAMVQFLYGADGLDPMTIEGDGVPVEFERNLKHVRLTHPARYDEPCLLPWQILQIAETEMDRPIWKNNCTPAFIEMTRKFVTEKIARKLAGIRKTHGMLPGLAVPDEDFMDIDIDEDVPDATKAVVRNLFIITENQLYRYLEVCLSKYLKAKIEPGTAVGAIGAQSIGEPGTQMTLKTFHFAGVASMNVTLGVPRIKEIINAAKVISTPIIKCELHANKDVRAARVVKGRVEKTTLGDVAMFMDEVYDANETYILIRLDLDAINKLQLETNIYDIAHAIQTFPKLKSGQLDVQTSRPDIIRVYIHSKQDESVYYSLKAVKRILPSVIITGLPSVVRAVISEKQGGNGAKQLLVEGYGLLKVMTTDGIIGEQTTSNHVMEVADVLGIEAARNTIINEIQMTMESHGMTIDHRHVFLLGDIMTSKGEVLGITRFGIAKMRDSVLSVASFEKTADHLFEAALYSKKDAIVGVSEQIIMGIPISIGTGLFKLLQKSKKPQLPNPRPLMLEA